MAYAVDGANIGEFDSHRCLRRLNVHACEEKYIERRKKSTLNAEVRRRSLSAARISSMYGRFGGLTGDISLTYGRHMRRKPQKSTPEVTVFAGDVPYISEKPPDKKQNLPYITQIDRLAWGITRSDFTRVHAAAYSRGAVRGFAVEFRTCN